VTPIKLNFKLHQKQKVALDTEATEVLYGGSAGSGKSFLCRVLLIIFCLWIKNLQCYLFRKHFADIVKNHVSGPAGFRVLLAPLTALRLVKIVETEIRFWNGSIIYLCHCEYIKHLDNYLGAEIHVLVIEEATKFTEYNIRFLRSRVRMDEAMKEKLPTSLKGKFPRIYYPTNPGGPSHNYFRKMFVKARAAMEIWTTEDSEGGFRRQFIPAFLTDNPSLNPAEYARTLMGLNDPVLIRAYLMGDWDIPLGNFFQEYSEDKHCVPDFLPPKTWFKFRVLDLGYAEPTAVYWLGVSDGEVFTDSMNRKRWFPAGALIAYREWYACNPTKPEQGLNLSNVAIAKEILARTPEQTSGITVSDSLPFQHRGEKEGQKPYEIFAANGVPLTKGDTSRESGWSMFRDRLIGQDDTPYFYLTESCVYARDYLPTLERSKTKPEDAQDKGPPTHSCDALRLGCTARPITLYAERELLPNQQGKYTFNDVFKRHQQRLAERRSGIRG